MNKNILTLLLNAGSNIIRQPTHLLTGCPCKEAAFFGRIKETYV